VVIDSMNLLDLVRKADSGDADMDFLREGIRVLAQALMEADVTARVGAARGERNPEVSTTQRNGYRDRRWDTRVGTVELAIPKLRQGSYFPDWLLEPRRRAERALASVVIQAYVEGISTRRVDDLARAMGVEGISKSQVSRICAALDEVVAQCGPGRLTRARTRCCGSTRWCSRFREGGRIVNTSALIATAVSAEGRREIIGLELGSAEPGASWTNHSTIRGALVDTPADADHNETRELQAATA
jgi:putative transposase